MLKDVTIKGSVVYDDEDFAEVMHMVGEGKLLTFWVNIELTSTQADLKDLKTW